MLELKMKYSGLLPSESLPMISAMKGKVIEKITKLAFIPETKQEKGGRKEQRKKADYPVYASAARVEEYVRISTFDRSELFDYALGPYVLLLSDKRKIGVCFSRDNYSVFLWSADTLQIAEIPKLRSYQIFEIDACDKEFSHSANCEFVGEKIFSIQYIRVLKDLDYLGSGMKNERGLVVETDMGKKFLLGAYLRPSSSGFAFSSKFEFRNTVEVESVTV